MTALLHRDGPFLALHRDGLVHHLKARRLRRLKGGQEAVLGKQRRLLCLSRPRRRSRSREGGGRMCKGKVALRSQLRQKLGKSLSFSQVLLYAMFLTPLLFHRTRSSTSTNAGSWLNSKRIYWHSPRCRLRRPSNNEVDVLLPWSVCEYISYSASTC